MKELSLTLLGDGRGDRRLLPVISWLARQHLSRPVLSSWADLYFVHPKPEGLRARVLRTIQLYSPDVLVVHRDSEGQTVGDRIQEIQDAVRGLASPPIVHLVPVRMQEAWLLFDELAIRAAADNPNGAMALGLPPLSKLESVPDPKDLLFDCLRKASGLAGRRLQQFRRREGRAAHRVADLITDFSPLRVLPAFSSFEQEIKTVCKQIA